MFGGCKSFGDSKLDGIVDFHLRIIGDSLIDKTIEECKKIKYIVSQNLYLLHHFLHRLIVEQFSLLKAAKTGHLRFLMDKWRK